MKAIHFITKNDVSYDPINAGGVTTNSHVNLTNGSYGSIYGGGEKATTTTPDVKLDGVTVYDVVYGGGDQAPITTNANVEIKNNCNILGDVFGGGNAGKVNGNTDKPIIIDGIHKLVLVLIL